MVSIAITMVLLMHAQMYWASASVTPLQQQSEHLRPLPGRRPPPWNVDRNGDQHVLGL
jgi:hypothetical protein